MSLDVWLEAGPWLCPQHVGPFLAQTCLPQSTGPSDATSIPLADALFEPVVRERLQHPHARKALFCNDAEITASSWILMHQEEALRASKRDFPWRASSSGSLCSNTTLHSHARPPQFQQGHSKAEGCMDFIKPRLSLPCPEILTCSICY